MNAPRLEHQGEGRGTLTVASDGTILTFNGTLAEPFQQRACGLLGRNIFSLLPPTSAQLPANSDCLPGIIGEHPVMHQLGALVRAVAPTEVVVHLQGESGVGKELVAEAIHQLSIRARQPMITLNCAAIPATLLESTLFGHVRGAYTDAHRDEQGFLDAARGGTLLLDEVNELPRELQPKLLRLLQSGEYARVGEPLIRHSDVRIITASNRDLSRMVTEGAFREDLYYRIAVFPISVPPLRKRRSDIPALVDHFICKYNARLSRSVRSVSEAALALLVRYQWPGNVRELENAVEHALVLTRHDELAVDSLPESVRRAAVGALDSSPCANESEDSEQRLVREALEQCSGNRTKAAQLLGLSRVGLWKKLRRLNRARAQKGDGE